MIVELSPFVKYFSKKGTKHMMTKLSTYAQIGKAELIQALGSSNRKKFLGIDIEVDEETKQVTSTIKRNSSTENSNSKKCLSTTSLLFWLYLHYLSPDSNGIVRDISIKDAAEFLGFSTKGIRKAIQNLSKIGYIHSSVIYKNTVTIMLPDFKNYFLKSEEGGHGYIELSTDNFLTVVSIANQRKKRTAVKNNEKKNYKDNSIINQIRLKLRTFLICEHSQRMFQKGKKAAKTVAKSIDNFLEFMPSYFYKKKLLEIFECISDVISYSIVGSDIILEAKQEDFSGLAARKKNISKIKKALKMKINTLERAIQLYNKNPYLNSNILKYAGIDVDAEFDEHVFQSYILTENDIDDLAKLCLVYGMECIIKAIDYIYSHFIIKGRTIKNFGGLVRRSLQSYAF